MKPIKIKKMGSYYLGGRKVSVTDFLPRIVHRSPELQRKININGTYYIEQAYVQYFIPELAENKYPIILLHGGGLTGSIWETTPDNRDGWLNYFLMENHSVYVVDNVERGRAGWCSLPGFWNDQPDLRSAERTWLDYRLGTISTEGEFIKHHNQQFPVSEFDTLLKYNVPRWDCNNELMYIALQQLIQKVGRCIVISHSQAGYYSIRAALNTKNVAYLVLLEPPAIPANDLLDYSLANDTRFLFMYGDNIKESEFWTDASLRGKNFADKLANNAYQVTLINLPELGILGNSHMMMMDKNNFDIARIITSHINS